MNGSSRQPGQCRPKSLTGWSVGPEAAGTASSDATNAEDAADLYRKLETKILPISYDDRYDDRALVDDHEALHRPERLHRAAKAAFSISLPGVRAERCGGT